MKNGISTSPQVSYKFDSTDKNEINGSVIVNRVIEKNAHQRHREFKSFFSCCNPSITSPPREKNQIGSDTHYSVTLFMCCTVHFILVRT